MKRTILIITAFILIFVFAACGEENEPASTANTSSLENESQSSEVSESSETESQVSETSEVTDTGDTQTPVNYTAQYVRSFTAKKIFVYPFAATAYTKSDLEHYVDSYTAEKTYDESFFENNSLILIFLEEGSGSIRHTVSNVCNNGIGEIFIDIDTYTPEICTDDMAYWCIMIEIDKKDMRNNISLNIYDETLTFDGDAAKVEENFSFALTWGTFGISSYDSTTGKLIKTTDTQTPEKYTTYYQLTELQREQIYALIKNLDVLSYPDEYDPNPLMGQDPPVKLILKVKTNEFEKTIKAENVIDVPIDAKASQFLRTCQIIHGILMQTEEWKALPDYEHYYY